MKALILCLFGAAAIHTLCLAAVKNLSPEYRKVLQNSSRFRELHASTNLPPAVLALCVDENGRLADPGQKWEVTDVISDRSLPRKRLIWAATDGEYFVVHYEAGGIAHSFHMLLAKTKRAGAIAVWRAAGFQKLGNFKAFLGALEADKLDDDATIIH